MSAPKYDIRDEDGQALVEFALVLPVLVLILFSMLHFGKAFNYWNDATHLTAEAARFAAVNRKPDPSNAQSLQAQIRDQVDTAELRNGTGPVTQAAQVCVDFPNGTSNGGDPVRITLSFKYAWIPLLRDGIGKPMLKNGIGVPDKTVTATTVMRLETPPTNYSAGCA
jgi:hypothetical protein